MNTLERITAGAVLATTLALAYAPVRSARLEYENTLAVMESVDKTYETKAKHDDNVWNIIRALGIDPQSPQGIAAMVYIVEKNPGVFPDLDIDVHQHPWIIYMKTTPRYEGDVLLTIPRIPAINEHLPDHLKIKTENNQ
jgi:hypothetical protein